MSSTCVAGIEDIFTRRHVLSTDCGGESTNAAATLPGRSLSFFLSFFLSFLGLKTQPNRWTMRMVVWHLVVGNIAKSFQEHHFSPKSFCAQNNFVLETQV